MSTALLPVTLSMLCAGMAGIFLVLGVLVLGVYALNKFSRGNLFHDEFHDGLVDDLIR